jgi:hypothetical protein
MWLWLLGIGLTVGGVFLARAGLTTGEAFAPALGWLCVVVAMVGACLLVYKASTQGILD